MIILKQFVGMDENLKLMISVCGLLDDQTR